MTFNIGEEFNEKIARILEIAEIQHPEKILVTSNITFKRLGLSDDDIDKLKSLSAKKITKKFITADESINRLSDRWKRIPFNCTKIDELLQGGIPLRGITEIFGKAGAGKSQLGLQLCLTVQFPIHLGGLQKGAVYICTECPFPSKRLNQIIDNLHKCYGKQFENYKFDDRIFIEHIDESESLLNCISMRLPKLMSCQNIGLIVIDSIGAIYRIETSCYKTRANNLRKLSQLLTNLSNQYNCGVLCINQVTSVSDAYGNYKIVPCLGLAWANLIHTRIQIHRTDENLIESQLIIRKMEVIFAPDLPPNTAEFLIATEGIVDVPIVN